MNAIQSHGLLNIRSITKICFSMTLIHFSFHSFSLLLWIPCRLIHLKDFLFSYSYYCYYFLFKNYMNEKGWEKEKKCKIHKKKFSNKDWMLGDFVTNKMFVAKILQHFFLMVSHHLRVDDYKMPFNLINQKNMTFHIQFVCISQI